MIHLCSLKADSYHFLFLNTVMFSVTANSASGSLQT